MTPQEIDAMGAGREMDVLVAEKIFGYKVDWEFVEPRVKVLRGKYDDMGWLPNYSSDPTDAWQVVDKIAGLIADEYFDLPGTVVTHNYMQLLQVGRTDWAATWGFPYLENEEWWERASQYSYSARADSAPLVICRAALKAISST